MKPEEGLCFIGRIGSGKTTLLRIELQKLNCPFMWFTTKADEADAVCGMFNAKRFEGGFNPFVYEMTRPGGDAVSLAHKLTDINEVLTRADKKGEAFWESNFQAALMHACNVIFAARGDSGSLAEVYRFLMSTPESKKEVDSPEFRESICFLAIRKALWMDDSDPRTLAAVDYFLDLLPSSGEKVRGAVISQASTVLLPFTLPPLKDAMCGATTCTPETLSQEQTVLVHDIATYGKTGQVSQLIMSFFMQEYLLRRRNPTPFAMVKDEYQTWCHPDRDIKAQTIARSQKLISVIAFQTLPVLEEGLGADLEARVKAQAVYACHVNKWMLNNNCPETNEHNARIIGQEKQMFYNISSPGRSNPAPWDFLGVGERPTFSMNQTFHYRVFPIEFTRLLTGGEENNFIVQAIYHNGHEYQRVSYKQCNPTHSRANSSNRRRGLLRWLFG